MFISGSLLKRFVNRIRFYITEIDTTTEPDALKPYIPIIQEYILECFGKSGYSEFKGVWIFVRDKSDGKVISVLSYNQDVIWNVCTPKKFRGMGGATKGILYAVEQIKRKYELNPKVKLDRTGIYYVKLRDYYVKLGFEYSEKLSEDNIMCMVYRN